MRETTGRRRVPDELFRIRDLHELHLEPGVLGTAGNDVAIAGIVAGTADDGQGASPGPTRTKRVERRPTGAVHQPNSGYGELVDGAPVERAHFRCREEPGDYR